MKNTIRFLFGFLMGSILFVLFAGDNLSNIVKVATMQVDTVYCISLSKVEIDVDTVRTFRKDKLIIVTGIKEKTVDYNVQKSEWMDSILLTKPNRYNFNGWRLYIYYDDFYMYEYTYSRDHIFIEDYNGDWVLYHNYNLGKGNRVSKQTEKNVETVMDRYWAIVGK